MGVGVGVCVSGYAFCHRDKGLKLGMVIWDRAPRLKSIYTK